MLSTINLKIRKFSKRLLLYLEEFHIKTVTKFSFIYIDCLYTMVPEPFKNDFLFIVFSCHKKYQ